MVTRPNPDPRLLEAIEACRPGSEDASEPAMAFLAAGLAADPQLAELYQKIQKADGAVGEAFQDVPVPDGLAERILARLKTPAGQGAPGEPAPPAGPTPDPIASAPPRRRMRRRWLLAVGSVGALAGAAALVAVFLFPRQPNRVYSPAEIRQLASDLFEQQQDAFGTGPLVDAEPPPGHLPYSADVVQRAQRRWRWVDLLERRGLAYDITLADGKRATLYVVRCQVGDLPRELPPRPAFTSGRRSTSAWQEGELLYVLVVDGNARTYHRFREPGGPIA
jgi:hypothetical protein